ncbi:MAG: TetR/AcrR family transcriptional regulator [Phenylobacterium sp.]
MKNKRPDDAEPAPLADARVQRSKEAVLQAAFELLTETGLSGVSVDEVARRSGVAKTTIYRHWPTRSALLLDACGRLTARPEAPDTGSLKGDLIALAELVARRLSTGRWSSVLPSVIDAAEREPALAELHARLHADMMGAFRTVIARAHDRGELGRETTASELIEAIVGALFYRRWFSREPLTPKVARAIVERALR